MADITEKESRELSTFKKVFDGMVSTNDTIYGSYSYEAGHQRRERIRVYSAEEIEQIITSGSFLAQKKLSQDYFNKNGFYFMTIIYYATLLKYTGLLIPNPTGDLKLDSPKLTKVYNNAVTTVDNMKLPGRMTGWALKALINGCYYGVVIQRDKETLNVIDLPATYCASNYKDLSGNNIIEFNLAYFDTISIKATKKQILKVYPECIREGYRKWKAGKGPQWIFIPSEIGLCFPFIEGESRPPFLSVIPATLNYDEGVDYELDKAAEEIKKILVQKVPHNATTNELVFEPDEALEMHKGAVNMMKSNPNVSVLTTYADVDSVVTKSTADTTANSIEKLAQSVYYEAGISGKLFGVDTATAIDKNIKVGIGMMMMIANRFADFITYVINDLYKNSNISFTYKILPISYQNDDTFIDNSFKLASSGYSFIVPALALGLSQRDLVNLKDLENNVMKLTEVLLPLSSAFTASSNDNKTEGGAPTKDVDDKSPETLRTEESRKS